jgi:magnesium chelatase family protein
MNEITVRSAYVVGVEARVVEIRITRNETKLEIHGMHEASAKETKIRVRAALSVLDSDPRFAESPLTNVSVHVGGSVRGAGFDLPIALGILALREGRELPGLVVGELSLAGEVRAVRGIVPIVEAAHAAGLPWACIPEASASEAVYGPPGLEILTLRRLGDVRGSAGWATTLPPLVCSQGDVDLADIRQLEAGRLAVEVAVATGQNLLLLGPPGAGKIMLARRVPGIMPDPTDAERREIARFQSAAGLTVTGARPFRAPHHTASTVAIVGGGDPARPGEMTLAHGGVLLLDELPELSRATVEAIKSVALRGSSSVARIQGGELSHVTMPAKPLIIIGSMNLCPCGSRGNGRAAGERGVMGAQTGCTCSPERVQSYLDRVIKPLREIFPLAVVLEPVRVGELRNGPTGESSKTVRERIGRCRALAQHTEVPISYPMLAFDTVMKLARPQ